MSMRVATPLTHLTPSTWASNERNASTVLDGFSASYSSDAFDGVNRLAAGAISSGKAWTDAHDQEAAVWPSPSVAPVDNGSTMTQSRLPSLRCFYVCEGLERVVSRWCWGVNTLRASSIACWTVFEERQAR